MLWAVEMKKNLGTSWGGKIGEEGDYNIMGEESFQEIVKSTHTLKDGGKIILSDGLGAVVQVQNFMIMVTRDVSPRAYEHKHEQTNMSARAWPNLF